MLRWTLYFIAAWLMIVLALALVGCAPTVEYRTIPAWLIPAKPTAPTVPAKDLTCLTDEVYLNLVERDRACWQYARELRALLGEKVE